MGINVYVGNSDSNIDNKAIKDNFINNDFSSSDLRYFGIDAWIPKFNEIIGEEDAVDTYAWEMKSTTQETLQTWYNHALLHDPDNIMTKYLGFCVNNNYTLTFW